MIGSAWLGVCIRGGGQPLFMFFLCLACPVEAQGGAAEPAVCAVEAHTPCRKRRVRTWTCSCLQRLRTLSDTRKPSARPTRRSTDPCAAPTAPTATASARRRGRSASTRRRHPARKTTRLVKATRPARVSMFPSLSIPSPSRWRPRETADAAACRGSPPTASAVSGRREVAVADNAVEEQKGHENE